MTASYDESYLWTSKRPSPFLTLHTNHGCDIVPITQEKLMSQDTSVRPHAGSLPASTAPTPAQPGVASALDALDYQRAELAGAISGLVDRIAPILTSEEPSDPNPNAAGKMYDSTVARSIEEHADGLKRMVDHVRSVTRRIDV